MHSLASELRKLAASKAVIPIHQAEKQIFETLKKGSPVRVKIVSEAAAYGGGYFDQVKKEIGIAEKDFHTLAHEVGHATLDQNILGRIIQSRPARVASSIIPAALAGIGAGLLIAKGKSWGLLIPAALSAPTILSEFLASRKGGHKLEEAGANKPQMAEYANKMREGLSSYMVAPALGTLIALSHKKAQ